jgi:hypothetical protein
LLSDIQSSSICKAVVATKIPAGQLLDQLGEDNYTAKEQGSNYVTKKDLNWALFILIALYGIIFYDCQPSTCWLLDPGRIRHTLYSVLIQD